jgi:hypothetical protein
MSIQKQHLEIVSTFRLYKTLFVSTTHGELWGAIKWIFDYLQSPTYIWLNVTRQIMDKLELFVKSRKIEYS